MVIRVFRYCCLSWNVSIPINDSSLLIRIRDNITVRKDTWLPLCEFCLLIRTPYTYLRWLSNVLIVHHHYSVRMFDIQTSRFKIVLKMIECTHSSSKSDKHRKSKYLEWLHTVPTFNSRTKCVGSPGIMHDQTLDCHPFSWAWMHGCPHK